MLRAQARARSRPLDARWLGRCTKVTPPERRHPADNASACVASLTPHLGVSSRLVLVPDRITDRRQTPRPARSFVRAYPDSQKYCPPRTYVPLTPQSCRRTAAPPRALPARASCGQRPMRRPDCPNTGSSPAMTKGEQAAPEPAQRRPGRRRVPPARPSAKAMPAGRGPPQAEEQAARTPPSPPPSGYGSLRELRNQHVGPAARSGTIVFRSLPVWLSRSARSAEGEGGVLAACPAAALVAERRHSLCRTLRADRTPRAGVRSRTERRPHGTQPTWDIPLSLPVGGACGGIGRPARPMGGEGTGPRQ